MRRVWLAAVACLLAGCAGREGAPTRAPSQRAAPAVPSVVLKTEPWTSFPGQTGTLTRTNAYRIYTTATDPVITRRMPVLAESALARYRSALGELPAPPAKLDTYVMATRPQWVTLTRIVMRERAEPYLRIARGGFAAQGRGLFWDIGPTDTLSLAAHEGWHQYTQRALKTRLPPWLDEGIATYHEGFKWPLNQASPEFLPWANPERFDQLRSAHARGRLKPLSEIVTLAPGDLIGRDETGALDWYAQVWAAVHFLREGEGGRYAGSLSSMLADAASGRLWRTLARGRGRGSARAALSARGGGALLIAYTEQPIETLDRQYAAFVARVVSTGGRDRITRGDSPVR